MSSSSVVSVKTNLADYPITMAMKDGRVTSSLVQLDYCGPKTAHDGFKAMLRAGRRRTSSSLRRKSRTPA
jgi:4,5-dihydroxyphthalate decarboxylase